MQILTHVHNEEVYRVRIPRMHSSYGSYWVKTCI